MAKVLEKKPPLIIFLLYLAVAIIGVSSFSAAGTFLQNNESLANSRGFLHSINHNIDFLVENTTAINRGYRSQPSSLRTFMPYNVQNTETYFTAALLQTVDEYCISIPKNTILVNLRI